MQYLLFGIVSVNCAVTEVVDCTTSETLTCQIQRLRAEPTVAPVNLARLKLEYPAPMSNPGASTLTPLALLGHLANYYSVGNTLPLIKLIWPWYAPDTHAMIKKHIVNPKIDIAHLNWKMGAFNSTELQMSIVLRKLRFSTYLGRRNDALVTLVYGEAVDFLKGREKLHKMTMNGLTSAPKLDQLKGMLDSTTLFHHWDYEWREYDDKVHDSTIVSAIILSNLRFYPERREITSLRKEVDDFRHASKKHYAALMLSSDHTLDSKDPIELKTFATALADLLVCRLNLQEALKEAVLLRPRPQSPEPVREFTAWEKIAAWFENLGATWSRIYGSIDHAMVQKGATYMSPVG